MTCCEKCWAVTSINGKPGVEHCRYPNCPYHMDIQTLKNKDWKFVCFWTDNEPEIQRRIFLTGKDEAHLEDYATFTEYPFTKAQQAVLTQLMEMEGWPKEETGIANMLNANTAKRYGHNKAASAATSCVHKLLEEGKK